MQARGILTTTGDPMVLQGFVLLSFGFIALALALTLAALPTNAGLVITLGLSAPPQTAKTCRVLGGWFLVASAFFAYYTGAALVVNSS